MSLTPEDYKDKDIKDNFSHPTHKFGHIRLIMKIQFNFPAKNPKRR